jgi:hypothetical protein
MDLGDQVGNNFDLGKVLAALEQCGTTSFHFRKELVDVESLMDRSIAV